MELKVYDHDYYEKDPVAQRIYEKLRKPLAAIEGLWLYREPEMKTEGNEYPTFTIVSPNLGLVFIKAYNYSNDNLTCIEKNFWTIDGQNVVSENKRFRNYVHKILSKINDPLVDFEKEVPKIKTYYVFPYISNMSFFDNITLSDNEILVIGTHNISFEDIPTSLTDNDYRCLLNIVQNANIINKTSNIYVEEPAKNVSEAIVLNNKRIALFDNDQLEASLTITDKSERIRGLAGSGKTVLLAIKAAKLHKRFPDKKIAFVFFTKSLYSQTTNLIRKYYNQIADDEPNWDNLMVMHSWGGTTVGNGFYYSVCKECGLVPKTLRQGSLEDHCKELLETDQLKELYDFILIDEAQDFPLSFFQVVQKVAKSPKKVVVAYDELQSTNDIIIPEFEELFGKTDNVPNIPLDAKYDYILKKSYRNTIDVLITAFSFGFGFYDEITQIIQDETTWNAFGFETNSKLEYGEKVVVTRPHQNSPNSITNIYSKLSPVSFSVMEDSNVVAQDVAIKIKDLIYNEKVKPTDILVIDIQMNRSNVLNLIQNYLLDNLIDSHIPGLVTDSREFFQDGKVTLSTPRNAKGNEVPVVFVVGCEDIYAKTNATSKRQARNFMFISITRSKGWVSLYAAGKVKTKFQKEIKSILANCPNIVFNYPSAETIKQLSKIDFLTKNPKAKNYDDTIINKIKKAISSGDGEIIKQLIALDPELKANLQGLLGE